jgi:hypothetical protein
MRHRPLLATLLATGLLVGACSQSDPSAKEVREDLAEALQKGDDALSRDQAECYAELIVEKVGADEVNDVSFSAKEPSDEVAEELATVAATARDKCDLQSAP